MALLFVKAQVKLREGIEKPPLRSDEVGVVKGFEGTQVKVDFPTNPGALVDPEIIELADEDLIWKILFQCYFVKSGRSTDEVAKDLGIENSYVVQVKQLALHMAAHKGLEGAVELLLKAKCPKDTHLEHIGTPLLCAIKNGHTNTAAVLIEKGADVQAADEQGDTIIYFPARSGDIKALEFCFKGDTKININHSNKEDQTPLHAACIAGKPASVDFLIQHGATINALDRKSRTPLHYAVLNGHKECVEILLRARCKPDIFDKDGYTPLMHAVIEKRAEMVTILTESKDQNQSVANINRANEKNITPLMLACQYSDLACVRELIRLGASLDDADIDKHTAMHYAVRGKQCATLEFILGITEAREEIERREKREAEEEAKRKQEEEKRRAEEEEKRRAEEEAKKAEDAKKAAEEKKTDDPKKAPTEQGQGGQDQGQGGQGQPAQGQPAQTGPTPTTTTTPTPAQTGPAQTGPAQTGPAQTGPAQTGPAQGDQKDQKVPAPDDEKAKKKKKKVIVQWQCRQCAENSEITLHPQTTAHCSKCGFQWRALLTQIYLFAAEEGVKPVLEFFHSLLGNIPNLADEDGVTPLMKAASKNRAELCDFLIATMESEIEARDDHGQTAIFYATRGSALETVKALRSAGAGWDVSDRKGMTPFAYAAKEGELSIIEHFVEKANAEIPDVDGLTVLAQACQCEDANLGPKAVQLLISHRIIKVDSQGNDGDTPLLRSARQRRWEVVRILIGGGANVSFRGRDNITLLLLACWEKQHAVVAQILDLEDIKKDVLGYLIEEGKFTIQGTNSGGVVAIPGWATDPDFISEQIKNVAIKENTDVQLEKFFIESKKVLPRRSLFVLEAKMKPITVKLEKSGTSKNLNSPPPGSPSRPTGIWGSGEDDSGMDTKYEGKIEITDGKVEVSSSSIPSPSRQLSRQLSKDSRLPSPSKPRADDGVELMAIREEKIDDEDLQIDPALLGTVVTQGGSIIGSRERKKRRESHYEKLDKSMDCWMFILLSMFAKKEDMRKYLIDNFALITLTKIHRTQAHNVLVHSIQETNVDVVDFLTQTIQSTFQKPIYMCLKYARDFHQRGEKTPSKQAEYEATSEAFTEMAVTLLNKIESDYVAMWVLEQGILEAALNWNIIGFVSTPRVYRIASYWWDKAWVHQDVDSTRQGILDPDKKSLPADYGDVHFGLFSLLRQSPYRFYRLPRVKFMTEAVAYGFYLALFSWMIALGLPVNEHEIHSVEIAFFVFGLGILLGELSQISGQEGTWQDKLTGYVDSGWNVLDIVILFLLGILFVLRGAFAFEPSPTYGTEPSKWTDTFYSLVMALEMLAMTMRLLFIFSVDPKFGPLVVSLRGMVKDVVLFFILYSVFYYGFFFAFMFVTDLSIENYDSPRTLFLTILNGALGGGADRDSFNELPESRRNVLEFISLLYVVTQSLVMVNLLIAMMANSYQSVQERAVAVSIYGFVQTVYQSDTSPQRLPAPFNLIEALVYGIINVVSTGCQGCLRLSRTQDTGNTGGCIQIQCRWCRDSFCYCDVRKQTCVRASKPPIKQEGLVACPNCHRSVDAKEIEIQKLKKRKTLHRGTAGAKEFASFCVFCVVLPFILVFLLFDLVRNVLFKQAVEDDGSEEPQEGDDVGAAALATHVQQQKQAKAARLLDETLDDIHEKVKNLKKD